MTSVPRLLADRLASDPGSPLLTFYDDATGERVELSTATVDNWVAKTANMLVDGMGLGPGDEASIDLPLHWQAAVAHLACAAAGLLPAEPDARPQVAFWVEGAELPAADEIIGLSLRPLGAPLTRDYAGVTDYAREVATYADHFTPSEPTEVPEPAPIAGRVLVTDPLTTDLLHGAIAGGGSLVLCRNPAPDALARRIEVERITAVWEAGRLRPA